MKRDALRLPVTIIGGYLGAGKTTLVNHLLRYADGLRLAVLVNEFGDLPIDADLIEAEDDALISIAGGCVCCAFGNDLTSALARMTAMVPRPDHMLIEASGVAIPGAIAGTVGLMQDVQVDGIVILADAEGIRRAATDKYMSDTVMRQLADANIMILNKTDLVTPAALTQTGDWLARYTANAPILTACQGEVAPSAVLGSFPVLPHTEGPSHHTNGLSRIVLPCAAPVNATTVAQELSVPGTGVIRAKGCVVDLNGERTVIQIVGNRWSLSPAPAGMATGMVVLGYKEQLSVDRIAQIQPA